jgi:diadenylate cyclase
MPINRGEDRCPDDEFVAYLPTMRRYGLFDQIVQIATRLRGYNPVGVVIELALIWAVMWLVWRFLRGTRGARVLKGVGFVLVIALLLISALPQETIGFERLRFLVERFLGFAAIAMVIVFQPELRRALVRLGEARLFRGAAMDMENAIGEIVKATGYLSKNKIGAIMAIEREVGLRGIVEEGTRLNAQVSADLLKTIFWPGSALHDMGVVIHQDKIVSAGVQFPLAESDDVAQELGSRHRAAMGLSLEADCLVIVVSEETGSISLAERGNLLRKLSPETLESMLRRSLMNTVAAPADGAALPHVASAAGGTETKETGGGPVPDKSAAHPHVHS